MQHYVARPLKSRTTSQRFYEQARVVLVTAEERGMCRSPLRNTMTRLHTVLETVLKQAQLKGWA